MHAARAVRSATRLGDACGVEGAARSACAVEWLIVKLLQERANCNLVRRASATSAAAQQDAASSKLFYAVSGAPHHDRQPHPETAKRVPAILAALERTCVTSAAHTDKLRLIKESRSATMEEVTAVHEADYIQQLKDTADNKAPTVVADFDDPDGFTYMTSTSYDDALKQGLSREQASGAALALVDAVVEASKNRYAAGDVPAGYSIARPPGHHATANQAMGFCLLNNVAIAARYAQQHHGLKKVMILDWDVHHGNGTNDLFYNDDSVLMIDMHEDGVWPFSGLLQETGSGQGQGHTINIPMPIGSGDAAARLAFDKIIQPAAIRFQPNIILISAGYDAHWRDPLEKLNFYSSTYHFLTRRVKQLSNKLCGGRLVVLMEGGYSLQGLSESVSESFLALLGEPPYHQPDTEVVEPMDEVWKRIAEIRKLHGLEQGTR